MLPNSRSFAVSVGMNYNVLIKPRKYQLELAEPGLKGHNYICIAPTGSGKTLVAALVIANHLQKNKHKENCHVLFIVNTKPLAEQQTKKIKEYISNVKVDVYTGDSPNLVADSFKQHNNISVCTAGKVLDELCQEKVKFSQFSLIVFDECHHARKSHPYAELMKMYLERKMEGECCLLQIMGMTASPGAGDNSSLDESKTIDHLKNLMALLDATGGIKTIQENVEELQNFSKSSSFTRRLQRPRNPDSDPFICDVVQVMKNIEGQLGFDDIKSCAFEKWSQGYETRIQQIKQPLEMSFREEFRDSISSLKQLYSYCTALGVYVDLRAADAIRVMEDHSEVPENDAKATPQELHLKQQKKNLIQCLKRLPIMENPMLRGIEQILVENFSEVKESRAILFVRTKKHTDALKEWILENCVLKDLGIRPGILTGHSSDKGSGGMTKVEQTEALKKFHDGAVNVLLATSVGEEGLDIPECNVVIRYLHVSNEISKVQTEGRARAENSNGYTILSANSRRKYQEMKNEELVQLVNTILENNYLPCGKQLQCTIAEIQRRIVLEKQWKRQAQMERGSYRAEQVILKCKKCKIEACSGTDVYTIGENESFHYVVYNEEFKKKYITKPHEKPRFLTTTVFKVHKIRCSECDNDWGVECFWPKGHVHPIIKCKGFVFDVDGRPFPVSKWSSAPFKPAPLASVMKSDSDDSSNED